MQAKLFLPPVAALAVAGLWIGSQRRSISALELESEALRGHLEIARQVSGTGAADPSFAGQQRSKSFRQGSKIDWKKIAAAQAAMRPGDNGSDMRAMVELQRTLLALTAEEILAGLDEIAALDLSNKTKHELEGALIGILAQKDPQLALERFADRIADQNGTSWQLASAFQNWSGKDPTAAAAWMDRQIEAGTFDSKSLDGRNDTRLRFEAGLIQTLAASDPAAAARRLAALPEDQRGAVFQEGMFFRLQSNNSKAVADLIRSQVPENERAYTLARVSSPLVHQGGYEKVGSFLGEIGASPAERAAIVGNAIEDRLTGQDEMTTSIEETRAWIVAQAPADAERLSGEALAHLSEWLEFPELAKEALKYQQASGNDEALVAFLTNAPDESRFEILELAEKITDPAKREEVTRRFINNPNRTAPPAEVDPRSR